MLVAASILALVATVQFAFDASLGFPEEGLSFFFWTWLTMLFPVGSSDESDDGNDFRRHRHSSEPLSSDTEAELLAAMGITMQASEASFGETVVSGERGCAYN